MYKFQRVNVLILILVSLYDVFLIWHKKEKKKNLLIYALLFLNKNFLYISELEIFCTVVF